MPAETSTAPERIFQLGLGFWASKAMLTAVELGVFTELAREPLSLDQLREHLGLSTRGTRDFFDALVSLGMLERTDGSYRNTPETDLFLDRNKPSYAGGLLEMANARLYPFWGSLTEGLQTGRPQNEARTGGDFFAALYRDDTRLRQFAHAMTGISMGPAVAIAERFPWRDHKTFVDLGTAEGNLPVQVALRHPHLTGTGTDLAQLEPAFNDFVAQHGLSDRLHFQANDFLQQPLPRADVIVMGHILHDWDLEQKRALIRKAFEAVPEGGAVVVYDMIIDDERRENAMGLLMSLNMLIETPGGFDYTGADCQAWLAEAGFTRSYTEHLVGPESMVVGIK
jgi:O-methyltransferase/methyltransferase family protein